MENEDELYQKLVTLLKLFKNRPYHLAKYLMENSALNEEFKNILLKSDKLKEVKDEISNNLPAIHFDDISKMHEYFKSLTEVSSTHEELSIDLNKKLIQLLKEEKYEDAARLRDYMISKNIKRNK